MESEMMTNAEKYLKKDTDLHEFAVRLTNQMSYLDDLKFYSEDMEAEILHFLKKEYYEDD